MLVLFLIQTSTVTSARLTSHSNPNMIVISEQNDTSNCLYHLWLYQLKWPDHEAIVEEMADDDGFDSGHASVPVTPLDPLHYEV